MSDDWVNQALEETGEHKLTPGQVSKLIRHNEVLRDNLESVTAIKEAINSEDSTYARQLWQELSEDEQIALYVAPTYGGIFTTSERKVIKEG